MANVPTIFILQSGFVTLNGTFLTKDQEKKTSIKDALLMTQTGPIDTNHFYDEGIENLFNLYRAKNTIINEFQFRQEAIKEFFRVFEGHKDIGTWIKLQLTQRSVGYMHRQFIAETFGFQMSGLDVSKRKVQLQSYFSILQATEVSRHTNSQDTFNASLEDWAKREYDTLHLLKNWTKDKKSFEDLIYVLHVIFGRRNAIVPTDMVVA